MTVLTRRLRSLLIALAVLALSAGAVLAGRSALSAPVRPDVAVTHADGAGGSGDAEETEPGEAPETDQGDTDKTETPEALAPDGAAGGADAAAPANAGTAGVHPDNHGKLVSEAAQAPTPAGSDNHGQYVRTIAMDNHGHDTAAQATKKAKPTR